MLAWRASSTSVAKRKGVHRPLTPGPSPPRGGEGNRVLNFFPALCGRGKPISAALRVGTKHAACHNNSNAHKRACGTCSISISSSSHWFRRRRSSPPPAQETDGNEPQHLDFLDRGELVNRS